MVSARNAAQDNDISLILISSILHLSFSSSSLFTFLFLAALCPATTQAMTGREILHKMKEKVGLGSSADAGTDSGKGKSKISKHVTHGYHLIKGKSHHAMEDFVVAQFKEVDDNELGLFAIFDGHLSHIIPDYLRSNLFDNILKETGR